MDSHHDATLPAEGFVRSKKVLQIFPFSRTTLWRKINAGQFPEPRHFGSRITAWDVAELRAYIKRISAGEEQ